MAEPLSHPALPPRRDYGAAIGCGCALLALFVLIAAFRPDLVSVIAAVIVGPFVALASIVRAPGPAIVWLGVFALMVGVVATLTARALARPLRHSLAWGAIAAGIALSGTLAFGVVGEIAQLPARDVDRRPAEPLRIVAHMNADQLERDVERLRAAGTLGDRHVLVLRRGHRARGVIVFEWFRADGGAFFSATVDRFDEHEVGDLLFSRQRLLDLLARERAQPQTAPRD